MTTNSSSLEIVEAHGHEQVQAFRELLIEYWQSLHFDHSLAGFKRDVQDLPGIYEPPAGCILLALCDAELAGCVALRRLDSGICEMKRLYVKPAFRGKGIGRMLARRVIEEARRRGYRRMRLDTLPVMTEATALYRSLGFGDIPPYTKTPIPLARHMELVIGTGASERAGAEPRDEDQ